MESRPAGKGVFLLKERRENSVYCPGSTDNIGMGISYCAGSCTGRGHCFCMGIEQGSSSLSLSVTIPDSTRFMAWLLTAGERSSRSLSPF